MSFDIRRNPTGLPEESRRGVITTLAGNRSPLFWTRWKVPSHFPCFSAISMISCGLPAAISSGVCKMLELALPTTSSGA